MTWTPDRKVEAVTLAPMTRDIVRPDTNVVERPGWYQLITPSAPGYLNEVYLSQVDARDAEGVIDEVVATYRSHGRATKWCVGPWTRPLDFGERLERRGFRPWDSRGMAVATSLEPRIRAGLTT